MYVLKLIGVGDEIGLILPDQVLARMDKMVGDDLFWAEIPKGVTLSPRPLIVDEKADAARPATRPAQVENASWESEQI